MKFKKINLKDIRKNQEMTQEELAKKVGCTSRAMGYYEKGERIPPTNIGMKIAQILNKKVEEIFEI